MIKHALFLILVELFVAAFLTTAADKARSTMPIEKADPDFAHQSGLQRVQAGAALKKKSCSEVYPVPDSAKHWTECKSGQFSECGGPNDCACKDPDDRLTWYDCKEGSFAVCQDDNTCRDSSRLLTPEPRSSPRRFQR